MSLSDWLSRLERLHFKAIDMGLERIRAVAVALGLFTNPPFVFTVAGTNGKGSTVAILDQLLRRGGYRTGCYTSPHLVHFNERVCINGQCCNDAELIAAFEAVEAARSGISLTYFEFTTLAAIWLFQRRDLDAWVLEVGLGGRLDAVNLWDPDVAVVTSIALDHQAWLGDTRSAIGLEKIGIGRGGRPLVLGEPDVPEAVRQQARTMGCQILALGQDFNFQSDAESWHCQLRAGDGQRTELRNLPRPELYLQNAVTALQALALSPFQLDRDTLERGLNLATLPGRRQLLHRDPDLMLDVGHNPHAADALARHLRAAGYQRVNCVLGMLSDKDVINTVMPLLDVVDRWYPVALATDRALAPAGLQRTLLDLGACSDAPAPAAHRAVKRLLAEVHSGELVLVFGSFYTVADVIQYGDLEPAKG